MTTEIKQIQLRFDTSANWASADPTMAEGEVGIDTDVGRFKIGDGSTAWSSLAFSTGDADTMSVTQTAHGFVAGNVLKPLAVNTYEKAQSDSLANAQSVGIVSEVYDANNFEMITTKREIILTIAEWDTVCDESIPTGLTVDTLYYLSPDNAGKITSAKTSTDSEVDKTIIVALSTTRAIFINADSNLIQTSLTINQVNADIVVSESLSSRDAQENESGIIQYANGALIKFDQWADVGNILAGSGDGEVVPYKKSLSNVYTGYETIGWEGNTTQQRIDFESGPGLSWVKNRDAAEQNTLFDLLRGIFFWFSDSNAAHTTSLFDNVTRVHREGYLDIKSTGVDNINILGQSAISWNWSYPLAKVWAPSADLPKKVPTPWGLKDAVAANASSGLSTGQYVVEVYNPLTGNGALLFVGNGANRLLDYSGGIAPECMIGKTLSSVGNGIVYHAYADGGTAPEDKYFLLPSTAAEADSINPWNDTKPTSNLISLGIATENNTNNALQILYYFAPVAGLQAFGEYDGNTGSEPVAGELLPSASGCKDGMSFIKNRTGVGSNWNVFDSFRGDDEALYFNLVNTETTEAGVGFHATSGITITSSAGEVNLTGKSYVFGHFGKEKIPQAHIDRWLASALTSSSPNDNVQVIFKYKGAATLNTELLAKATREGTPNWVTLTLSQLSTWVDENGDTWKLIKGVGDISGNAAGTNMNVRIQTAVESPYTEHNIRDLDFSWSA